MRMAPIHPDNPGKPIVKVKRTTMKVRNTKKVPTTQIKAPNTPMKSPNKPMKAPSTSTLSNVRRIKSPRAANKMTAEVKKELLAATSKSKLMTPNKVAPPTPSQTDKKKSWQSRLKPAHSGVPLPEKFKKMAEMDLRDLNDIF